MNNGGRWSFNGNIDVRVLATSNRDLRAEVEAGRLREDLYYRLAVLPLELPPLRERGDDVLQLCDHYLEQAAERLDGSPCSLSSDSLGGVSARSRSCSAVSSSGSPSSPEP